MVGGSLDMNDLAAVQEIGHVLDIDADNASHTQLRISYTRDTWSLGNHYI